MSTKKTTDNTIKYDPTSMNAFTGLQSPIQKNLTEMMQDPLKQQGFNLALQQAYKNNNQSTQQQINQLYSNLNAGGFGGGNMNAFGQSMLANIGRQKSSMNANSFINNYQNFKNLQFAATGQAQQYKPLQTGSKSVETTGGLGTWLPQVIGAGVGMATGFMGGGGMMGMLNGGAKGGTGQGGGGMFSGGLAANPNASASNPFLYSQPGQGGYNPFYGFGGNG